MCQERRKVLGTEQNLEGSLKTVFLEQVLRLANKSSFLRTDHTDDSCFSWEKYLRRSGKFSCPRQFAQLYSLDVDLGNTSHENYTHPALFALLPDKKETTYQSLLILLKNSKNTINQMVCIKVSQRQAT